MEAETIGVGIAALAAASSAFSAYTSRQAVDRAHRPFVWPAISTGRDPGGPSVVRVRLHNDGQGTAYDVRWSVGTMMEAHDGSLEEDAAFTDEHVSSVIRAIRPGEVVPPQDSEWLEQAAALPGDDVWWVLVRWTDAARVRWELSEQGPTLLRSEPRRLRTWPWQLWRPSRDW